MARENVRDHNLAAAAILVSIFCYGVMDASSKVLLRSTPAVEILFFRNLIVFVFVILVLSSTGARGSIRTQQPGLQIGRAVVGNIAVLLFIISFGSMQLSQVIAVSFLAPIFAAIWDSLIFRPTMTWRDWALALIGCACVWFILRPGLDVTIFHALLPLSASILLGFYLSAAKWLKPSESTLTVVLYFSLVGWVMSFPILFLNWRTPGLTELGLLLLIGCCGGIGVGLRNFSYRRAPSIFLGPFEYTGIIWAGLFGFVLFSTPPTLNLIVGTVVIIMLNLLRLFGLSRNSWRFPRSRLALRRLKRPSGCSPPGRRH
jgi:drug/metabolite transporter (DMT)-like permease